MGSEEDRMAQIEVDAAFDSRVVAFPKDWTYVLIALEPGQKPLIRTNAPGTFLPGLFHQLSTSVARAKIVE